MIEQQLINKFNHLKKASKKLELNLKLENTSELRSQKEEIDEKLKTLTKLVRSNFSLLYKEKWTFYKKHFSIDSVHLIGSKLDICEIYCENTKRGLAIYLDIKSNDDLNNISLIENNKIPNHELVQITTVDKAIYILENCPYKTPSKPNDFRLKEIIDFLKSNEAYKSADSK